MSDHREITHAQFIAEYRAQSDCREGIVFVCPACGTLQNARDLIAAGAGDTFEAVAGTVGFSCIGRTTGKGSASKHAPGEGCNWTLGGLFRIHTLTVVDAEGVKHPHFELASRVDADAHRAKQLLGGVS